MTKKYTRIATCILAAAVTLQAGCSQGPAEAEPEPVPATEEMRQPDVIPEAPVVEADSDEISSKVLPLPGDRIAGFVVREVGRIEELGADTILFAHEQSGAELMYIKNDDTNLGFNIGYRTPYIDETDTNHIFEHAIIASSEKYPSTNLFFDLAGKSFHTFVNAYTFPTFTCYPFSTQSEEQFIKMVDVYLSCMVAPDILTDENIYKREALRFELDAVDAPITMHGTVFSEDFGSLTDIEGNADDDVLKALYPGMTASNSIGRLHRNYQDLTYEKTKATYERCYHFDNSLLFLYGDMDYAGVLEFIDTEYLSKAVRSYTDLSEYTKEEVPAGHVEVRKESPAYVGDAVKEASVISYALDLSAVSWEELMIWDIMTDILESENSPLYANGQMEGINKRISADLVYYHQKPYLMFSLSDTDEEQKEAFMRAVNGTLTEIADAGFDEGILQPFFKADKIQTFTARNSLEAGIDATTYILNYWVQTGKTDIYRIADQGLEAVSSDSSQAKIKILASEALEPKRSALVVTVPAPGLAEALEAEQDAYLDDMKDAMTEAELEQMVQDTLAFRAWNENEVRNNEVAIKPADLPEPAAPIVYTKTQFGELVSYAAPVQADHVTAGSIYFDIGGIAVEDIYYLSVYQLLFGRLGTDAHSAEEVKNLTMQYLFGATFGEVYPEDQAGVNARAMTRFDWYCLTEDYDQSLDLLLEIITSTDFDDTESIKTVLNRYLPYYDQSRYGDRLGQAYTNALGYVDRSVAFANAAGSQELYWFMKEVAGRLENEPDYAAEFAAKMKAISVCLQNRKGMIMMHAAAADKLAGIEQAAAERLSELPAREREPEDYASLLAVSQRTAICVEDSMQYHVLAADMGSEGEISGKDLVYLAAAGDKYITPVLRFQNGAYSAGSDFSNAKNACMIYTYSDPNIDSTLSAFEGTWDYLKTVAITQEELDGYILNAYASAYTPAGIFNEPMRAMAYDVAGVDAGLFLRRMNDMKNVTLADQQDCAASLEQAFRAGAMATVGNQRRIEAAKNSYDVILNYKQPQ